MSRRTIFLLIALPTALGLTVFGGMTGMHEPVSTSVLSELAGFVSRPASIVVILLGIYIFDVVEVPGTLFIERIAEDPKALAIFLGALVIAFALVIKPGFAQERPMQERPMSEKRPAVTDTAESRVGTTEHPPNSNRGEYVEKCLAHVDLGPGYPYCAACASLWLDDAKVEGPIADEGPFDGGPIRSALSAHFMHSRLFVPSRKVRTHQAEIPRGSIAIWLKRSGGGHTAVVYGDDDDKGRWQGRCGRTIEANTSPSADAPPEKQREGGGIFGPKTRCINPNANFRLVGFAVPLS